MYNVHPCFCTCCAQDYCIHGTWSLYPCIMHILTFPSIIRAKKCTLYTVKQGSIFRSNFRSVHSAHNTWSLMYFVIFSCEPGSICGNSLSHEVKVHYSRDNMHFASSRQLETLITKGPIWIFWLGVFKTTQIVVYGYKLSEKLSTLHPESGQDRWASTYGWVIFFQFSISPTT